MYFQKFQKVGQGLYYLMVLNFLWFVFSFMGLLVGGIFPATAAVCSVQRKQLEKPNQNIKIFRTFYRSYKDSFLEANAIGYTMLGLVALCYLDFHYFVSGSGWVDLVASIIFFVLLIVVLAGFSWVFSVFVQYKLRFKDYIKSSIFHSLAHPLHTLLTFIALFTVIQLCTKGVPGLFPFIGISLPLFVCTTSYRYVFLDKSAEKYVAKAWGNLKNGDYQQIF